MLGRLGWVWHFEFIEVKFAELVQVLRDRAGDQKIDRHLPLCSCGLKFIAERNR